MSLASTVFGSSQFDRPFRKAHPVAVDDLPWRLSRIGRCTQRYEHWREVLDRRVRVRHAGRPPAKVEERVNIAGGEAFPRPCVELPRPVWGGGVGRRIVQERQTMRGETGPDDQ